MATSRLLGTAAGVILAAGAHAGDMPSRVKPSQQVKICKLYGEGYYFIPDNNTCIRLGGYVRADHGWNVAGARTPAYFGTQGAQDRMVAAYSTRHRANVQTDTRTETEYGTLRTLISVHVQDENSTFSFNVASAFVQWAGFTFGHARSVQDTWSISDSWHYILQQNNSDTGTNGVNQIAYTLELGNGTTLSVGAHAARRKSLTNLSAANAIRVGLEPSSAFRGQSWPDAHVSLKINQAWGYWATSFVAHDISATYYNASSVTGACSAVSTPSNFVTPLQQCGHPSDKVGWAAQTGAEFKMDAITPGDRLGFGARYAVGASGFGGGSNLSSAGLFGSGGNAGTLGEVAVGTMTDGVFVNGSNVELTTTWTVMAAYEHHWVPELKTSFYGGYSSVEHNSTAKSYFASNVCGNYGAGAGQAGFSGGSLATNCSPDWSFFQGGMRTQWTPARGLIVGVDTAYTHVWTAFNGTQATLAGVSTNPTSGSLTQLGTVIGARQAGVYSIGNQGIWSVVFRVQRNFNTVAGSLRRLP